MQSIAVLVVPEVEDFQLDVSHNNVVWINKNLGQPDLTGRNAKYLIPYWLTEKEGGNRIYHITDISEFDNCFGIYLGNSFILQKRWTSIGQRRRFEYHNLAEFEFVEICPGLLTTI